MADGFDIHLDEERAERLKAVAAAAGMEPSAYALGLLDQAISEDEAEDRRRFAEYQRTGDSVTVSEWMSELRARVAQKRAARG